MQHHVVFLEPPDGGVEHMPNKEGLGAQRVDFVVPLVLIQFLLMTVLALFVRDNGWDDGAITLAYARTFALDGKIALTGVSDPGEGFSSLSWFLLNFILRSRQ
jgi:hypothetical protein